MQQQPPISLQLLSQLKVKYFCSKSRHRGVRHLCSSWSQLPLQLTRRNGNVQKVVQLILRQISMMDKKICSQKVPVCLHWKVPVTTISSRYGQLQLHWINCWCWCTALHCCDRTGWGWSPCSCSIGIFERKSVLKAYGLLFVIVDGRVHAAHNGSDSSIIYFVNFPSVPNSVL